MGILYALIVISTTPDVIYGKQFTLPYVPQGMSYTEYKILTWKINYSDFIFSAFIPGYIHFMLDRKWIAAGIMFTRLVMTSASVWGVATLYSEVTNPTADIGKRKRNINISMSLALSGLIGNLLLTAFDVAHGKWLLCEMRTKIYYKYRKTLK